MKRPGMKAAGLAGAAIALGLACLAPFKARAQALCAVVKLEIQQKATLEREAFDAHLIINNSLPTQPLTDLKVQIFVKDADGVPAGESFFIKVSSLTGTTALDGTGVIQSSSTADIHWLIIPSSGTGGSLPAGRQYSISAQINATSNGSPQTITTFDSVITVHPQPIIKLEYALPYEVFGDEPLTAQVEPIQPYPLSVRVTNVGYGAANDFQIQSAQPVITDNKQGLAVDFKLIGTQVDGQTIPNTLLIPFGSVAPNAVKQASWIMTSSLSGRFINFSSTFTHAADLGGSLTSLLQSVTTYTLLKDVLVDLPGRDQTPDFLVNETMDRNSMQAVLDGGVQPPAQFVLESDQPNPLPVTEVPGALSGALSGANAGLTFTFTGAVSSNVWVHSYAPFSYGNTVTLTSAKRGDGKAMNARNVWISKHFNKSTLAVTYWLNVLDLTASTNTYTIQFDPAGLVTPPGTVLDLAAAAAPEPGALTLSWTAPGESGYTGLLFGGRYLIEAQTSSTTVFTPESAQVDFSTTTPPGDAQTYQVSGLIGNATNYLHLWTQNGGGGISALSNAATAYVLPNPPQGLQLSAVGSTSAFASWHIGNNALPIAYRLFASTAADGVAFSSTPVLDSFTSSFTFAGLPPDAAIGVYGLGLNPDTGVSGLTSLLGSTATYAAAPVPSALTAVSSDSISAAWGSSGNPSDTLYQVELSTMPSRVPVLQTSLLAPGTSFLFTGLMPDATYYGRVRARGRNGFFTAYADLGAAALAPVDDLPPVTTLLVDSLPAATTTLAVISTDTIGFSAVDAGVGVSSTFYSLDGATQTVFLSTFSLAVGTHTLTYHSSDFAGNTESVSTAALTVSPPAFSTGSADGVVQLVSYSSVTSVASVDDSTATAAALAQGLTAATSFYDLSPSGVPFDPPARLSFTFDPGAVSTAALAIYTFDGVAWDSAAVAGQQTASPATGTVRLSGTLAHASLYAVFAPSTAAPAAVSDLRFDSVSLSSAVLAWTAPAGAPVSYDLRRATFPLTAADFASATPVPAPAPGAAGSTQTAVLAGATDPALFVALRSSDAAGNFSALSNVASLARSTVIVAGEPELSFFAGQPVSQAFVSTTSTAGTVVLASATEQGLVLVSSIYDLGPEGAAFNPPATLTIRYSTETLAALGLSPADLTLYEFFPSSGLVAVAGQVLDPASQTVTAPITALSSLFALFGAPAAPALASLAVEPSSATLTAGATFQFAAVGTFTDGSTRTVAAAWDSGAPAVATVTAAGLATAVTAGTAQITASSGAISGSASLTVNAPASAPTLASISVVPSSAALTAGATQAFAAIGYFSDGSSRTLTASGDWTPAASLPQAIDGAATAFAGGKFYLFSGSPQAALAYDPAAGTWAALAAPPVNRGAAAAAAVGNVIYVFGGCVNNDCSNTTGANWAYDVVAGTWTQKASMPTARFNVSAAAIDGKVYAAGGGVPLYSPTATLEVYDPATDSWSARASMPAPRIGAGAGAVGGSLIVAGGTDNAAFQPLDARAEVMAYDPGTDAWSAKAPIPAADFAPGSAVLNGKLYLTGGQEASGAVSSRTWVYDAAADAWSAGPFLNGTRYGQASAGGAGLVVTAGGANGAASASFETLAPGDGLVWSSDAPSVAAVTAAGLATGVSTGTARIAAAAGAIAGSADLTVTAPSYGPVLASISVAPSAATLAVGATQSFAAVGYFNDGSSRTLSGPAWVPGPAMNRARVGASGAYASGRFYVIGGFNAAGTGQSAEYYDPAAGSWTTVAAPPINRTDAAAVVLGGKIYVIGGCLNADCNATVTPATWAYDPATDSWTQKAPLSTARAGLIAGVIDGKIYAAGGRTGAYAGSSVLEAYDPATDNWTTKASMPSLRSYGAGGAIGGRLYASGGTDNGAGQPYHPVATTVAYDPGTDSWSAKAPMPQPLGLVGSAVLDGALYSFGGQISSASAAISSATFVYDAASDSWTEGPDLNQARYHSATAAGAGTVFTAGAVQGNLESTSLETLAAPWVAWASDAPSVATVTAAGLATALSTGTAHVTASNGAVSGSAALTAVSPDATPPVTTISFSTPSFISSGVLVAVATRSSVTLEAVDPSSGAVAASGVAATYYSVDAPTRPATAYAGPFHLSSGTHTVYYYSTDAAGNAEAVSSATVAAYDGPFAGTVAPSSGPIGVTVSLAGFGFGTYSSVNSRLLFGSTAAPVSVWNDGQIVATVPGLSTGAYALSVVALQDGATAAASAGGFSVLAPQVLSVDPSSGPIGLSFTLTGSAFGAYANAFTQVLIGGATAPISVWNDATIKGTVPGSLAPGVYPLQVRRTTSVGGLIESDPVSFQVLGLSVAAVAPSTGPIGVAYDLTGSGFGAYASGSTFVLIGGATTSISVWNDTHIVGVIPALSTGSYPLVVERIQGGDASFSNESTFTVTALDFAGPAPSSGPIGTVFSLSGTGFGAYANANTRLLVGGTEAAVAVWNDTTITGTVPALPAGPQPVWIERLSGGGVESSATSYFNVVDPTAASISPSTGPIGVTFTIDGSGFGTYANANTRVLIGGATAAISVWNDASITGTVPALSTGSYPVTVVRLVGSAEASSSASTFTVTALSLGTPAPSSGPVGTVFTMTGSGFGAYANAYTRLLIGGTTAAVAVWNDSTIAGTVPSLPPGPQPVWIERLSGGGLQSSDTVYFDVVAPAIASVAPSSGPIGVAFTLTGSGFGTYSSVNTHVLLGGTSCPISVWNDTTIIGVVPGSLAPGSVPVVVERAGTGGVSYSTAATFVVVAPSVASVTPSSAPIGSLYTLTGSGFGTYATGSTRVLIGGTTTAISLWNDSTITGTVPALASGTYTLQVERQQGGYSSLSGASSFTVVAPEVADMTPSSAPIGAPFTITGSGFGAYSSINTHVRFNGTAAPISVWNDTTIKGTVPGAVAAGAATVVVERLSGSFAATGEAPAFLVLTPTISTVTPAFGPAGTAVTLNGFGFGPYAGASGTQLLVGGSTMAVAVWNDSLIRWTVPSSLADGTYPVVVSRTPAGGSVQSSSASFTVGTGIGTGALLAAAPLASRPDSSFEGDLNLPAAEGGLILTPSQAAVEVPPGALDQDTEITVARERDAFKAARTSALGHAGLGAAGEAISFGPEGTQFSLPVTIDLPYDPALVPEGALEGLAVHYFDPVTKTWTPLISSVDPVRHVVSARTSHFSLYQPLGRGIGTAAADASFGLKAVYAFPNPARGVNAVTIRVQPGQADSVSVRVYDQSGRKVHESSDFTINASLDDGNGLGAQITYDHVWDVSGVGSGVYTYAITARKAGQGDLHKTGRIGVVK